MSAIARIQEGGEVNTEIMFSSKSSDHLTPGWLLDLVEKVAPIGLDPCGHPLSESSRRASMSYFAAMPDDRPSYNGWIVRDGLSQDWADEQTWKGHQRRWTVGLSPHDEEQHLVFVNPPYGRALKDWAAKMASENDTAIIALVPARVDTAWWRALDPVVWCALQGRVKFLNSEGKEQDAAPFPSAVCLLHAAHLQDRFVEVFNEHGPIYSRVHSHSSK